MDSFDFSECCTNITYFIHLNDHLARCVAYIKSCAKGGKRGHILTTLEVFHLTAWRDESGSSSPLNFIIEPCFEGVRTYKVSSRVTKGFDGRICGSTTMHYDLISGIRKPKFPLKLTKMRSEGPIEIK